jgi:hypothetical protein
MLLGEYEGFLVGKRGAGGFVVARNGKFGNGIEFLARSFLSWFTFSNILFLSAIYSLGPSQPFHTYIHTSSYSPVMISVGVILSPSSFSQLQQPLQINTFGPLDRQTQRPIPYQLRQRAQSARDAERGGVVKCFVEAVVVEEHTGGGVDVWEWVLGLMWLLAPWLALWKKIGRGAGKGELPCRALSALLARSPSSS